MTPRPLGQAYWIIGKNFQTAGNGWAFQMTDARTYAPAFAAFSTNQGGSWTELTGGNPETINFRVFQSSNVEVSFYQGDPDSGGSLLSVSTIPAIPANQTRVVRTTWTATPEGNQEIYVHVDRANKVQESDDTNNKAFNTIAVSSAPDAVSDLKASTDTATSSILSWTAPGDDGRTGTVNNSTFTLQYTSVTVRAEGGSWSTTTAGLPSYVFTVQIPTTAVSPVAVQSYRVASLAPNTSYYFRIWTRDDFNSLSRLSNGATAATLAAIPGSAVTTFTVVTASSITVQWIQNSNPPNTLYELQIATSSDFIGTIDSSNTFNTFASTTNLSEHTTRYFRVRAVNQNNIPTAFLNLGSTITLIAAIAPITNLSALTGTAPGEIKLSWTAPVTLLSGSKFHIATTTLLSDATNTLYWNGKRDTAEIQIATSGVNSGDSQGFVVTGLAQGVTYYFRIWSRDSNNTWSTISNGATAQSQVLILGLSVAATSYNFGSVALSGSTRTEVGLIVTNNSNVSIDFSLHADTVTTGSPWSVGASTTVAPSSNTFLLRGVFHPSQPTAVQFGAEDVIANNFSLSQTVASGGRYTVDNSQTGLGIPPNGTRSLWLRLDMPTVSATKNPQRIQIVIEGTAP